MPDSVFRIEGNDWSDWLEENVFGHLGFFIRDITNNTFIIQVKSESFAEEMKQKGFKKIDFNMHIPVSDVLYSTESKQ